MKLMKKTEFDEQGKHSTFKSPTISSRNFNTPKNETYSQSRERMTYSVLINNVDDDDKPAVFLPVVHEGNPADLHISLERLS